MNKTSMIHPALRRLAFVVLLLTVVGAGLSYRSDSFLRHTALAQQAVTVVNAAGFNFDRVLAPDVIAAAFGQFATQNNQIYFATSIPLPTTLGGVRVRVGNSDAGLFFVAPTQINFKVPSGLADTTDATVTVTNSDNSIRTGTITIVRAAPGVFSARATGAGVAAAQTTFDGAVFQNIFDAQGNERDVDAGTRQRPNVLTLYATGIRNTPAANPHDGNGVAEAVTVKFQGVTAQVIFAGPAPGFEGLDQINVIIPPELAGFGSLNIVVSTNNRTSNTVTIKLGGQLPPVRVNPIAFGNTLNGDLTVDDQVQFETSSRNTFFFDAYRFTTTTANTTVAIDLRSSQFDAIVLLYRVDNNTLTFLSADDQSGGYGNGRIENNNSLLLMVLQNPADYVIFASTSNVQPNGVGSYTLKLLNNVATRLFYGVSQLAQDGLPEQRRVFIEQKFDELTAKAWERGAVRIIIGLRAAFQPEGYLPSAQAVRAQRTAIARSQDALLRRLTGYAPASVKRFETIPFLALEVEASGLEGLRGDADVISIQEDVPVPPLLVESTQLVGATTAWTRGFSGAGQTIAILDTGVDKNHPFLSGKVVSEACYSTTDARFSSTSVCPGGVPESTAPNSGLNCPLSVSACYHGTHVAGIAAGRGGSFSGVARDANVIAIQVFSQINSAAECASYGFAAPCVITYPSDYGRGLGRVLTLTNSFSIASVNMSLGGGQYFSACDSVEPMVTTAINNLRSVGIATVIASGNRFYTNALARPACISTAISVGSTTKFDAVSSFSNSASFLNLLAPGERIYSSVPGSRFISDSGTSMAAPHVAGAWAVLKSRSPNASVSQILTALTNTGVPIRDPRNGITKPRIQVDAALGGSCAYTLSPMPQTFGAGGGSGRVNVTANSGCTWQAASGVNWIMITSGASGNGNGLVDYLVQANLGSSARTGTITIAQQTITVRQNGAGASGAITAGDLQTSAGTYLDVYWFTGTSGDNVRINMSSTAFDPLLILQRNEGDPIVAYDDNGGGGTDAQITHRLTSAGIHLIIATPFAPNVTGAYTLSLNRLTSFGVESDDVFNFKAPGREIRDERVNAPGIGESSFERFGRRRVIER